MAIWEHFRTWLDFEYQAMYRGATPPDETKFFGILCANLTLDETMDIATVVSGEVITANGYARQNITFPDITAWDATLLRQKSDNAEWAFDATTADITWNSAAIIADTDSRGSVVVESINPTTDRLTMTAHPFVAGDRVCVTSLVTLATGIPANTLLYVGVPGANEIELFNDEARTNKVNIGNTGSGTHYVRNCNGRLVCFANESTQLIVAGTDQPLKIFVALANIGNNSGI